MPVLYIVGCCFNAHSQFSRKYSQKTPHSSPVRVRYGVPFVNPVSDWYSASVSVIIYVISFNIGPCYNGTWLYIQEPHLVIIIHADALAPTGARASVGTMVTIKLNKINLNFFSFWWFRMYFHWLLDIIEIGQWNLKSHSIFEIWILAMILSY